MSTSQLVLHQVYFLKISIQLHPFLKRSFTSFFLNVLTILKYKKPRKMPTDTQTKIKDNNSIQDVDGRQGYSAVWLAGRLKKSRGITLVGEECWWDFEWKTTRWLFSLLFRHTHTHTQISEKISQLMEVARILCLPEKERPFSLFKLQRILFSSRFFWSQNHRHQQEATIFCHTV